MSRINTGIAMFDRGCCGPSCARLMRPRTRLIISVLLRQIGSSRPRRLMKCEYALSHMPNSKVVNGYLRADLLEECRPLMEAWGNYCEPQPGRQVGGRSHKGKNGEWCRLGGVISAQSTTRSCRLEAHVAQAFS